MDELMSLESLLAYVVICESGDDSPVRVSVTELAAFVRAVKSAHELKVENERLKEAHNLASNWCRQYGKVCDINESLREQLRTARAEERRRCATLADQWGEARLPDNGGNALRNYAIYIRALGDAEPQQTKTYDAYDVSVMVAAATSGNISTIELAAQLIGQQPCDKCSFVIHHCRCEPQHPPRVTPEDTAKLQAMQEYIDGIDVDKLRAKLGIEGEGK